MDAVAAGAHDFRYGEWRYRQAEILTCMCVLICVSQKCFFLPEEGDDEDDPEYNFLAEIDEPDVEDYRNDKAVRITSEFIWERIGRTSVLFFRY